jgi:two-component system response regulator AtoC
VISSIKLHDLCGLDILRFIRERNRETVVLFLTAHETLEHAIEAMRQGSFNYLLKPLVQETLEAMLDKACEHLILRRENSYLHQGSSLHQDEKSNQMIAQSDLMKKILSDVAKIAKSHASVFISGESGTGKEVIAHAIHFQSLRASKAFIKVNCAAIPDSLLESEFFGHEKGSFTGAINKRIGRFELADKGTLLLDEISEIPIELQPKLLRAVQEMEFERVGGSQPIRVDVRLISTSNRSMKESIEKKNFREDLYYRLNVVPLLLPPLRERREDILPLAEYFLERLCLENHKSRKSLNHEARKKLLDYPWPGNIRELANVIERTVVMNAGEWIAPEHLGLDPHPPLTCPVPTTLSPSPFAPGLTLAEVEKRMILETLTANQQNRTKTAQILGISIRTLRNKLNAYKKTV